MKKLLFLLSLLFFASSGGVKAQQPPPVLAPTASWPVPFNGVPTGLCLSQQTAVNTTNGNFYSCNAGVWQFVGNVQGFVYVPSLPALCTPGVTASVELSVAPYFAYYCSATNTWSQLSGLSFVASLPALCTPGVTAPVELSVAPYTINYCSATNMWTASTGSITSQVAKGIPANSGGSATAVDSIVCTPPATNGTYNVLYNVTASAAVASTCPQVGVAERVISGATTTDIIGSSTINDAQCIPIRHDSAASGTVAFTLPTPTTLTNSNACILIDNESAQTDTVTPTTFQIQSNRTAAAASLSLSPGTSTRIVVDPFNASLWDAVTVNAPNSVNAVVNNAANTATAAMTLDMHLAGNAALIIPNGDCTGGVAGQTFIASHQSSTGELCINRVGVTTDIAVAATGGAHNTTCTNQVITVISSLVAPTCTSLTNAFLPVAGYSTLLTSGTSWTSPLTLRANSNVKITMVGGGNAGGTSGAATIGLAGGAGCTIIVEGTATTLGLAANTAYTYAIGSASGGSTTFNNGSVTNTAAGGAAGGTLSSAAIGVALGGTGGACTVNFGSIGTTAASIPGQAGSVGEILVITTTYQTGVGGSTPLGTGGQAVISGVVGNPGTGYGAGGSGGGVGTHAGGAGTGGAILIEITL